MNRILRNEKQRIRRRANRFIDFNYFQQKSSQDSKQLHPASVEESFVKNENHQRVSFVSVEGNDVADHITGHYDLKSLIDEDEDIFEVLPSDSSDDDDENEHLPTAFDLKKALAEWVINTKTPAYHVDELLLILRHISPSLPKSCKTLCKTPRVANTIEMDNGHYLHIGLKNSLDRFIIEHNLNDECIIIDIGVDGVGVSNSSSSNIWPILVSVVGYKDILLIGAFHGTKKPSDVNNFLQRFVDEYNDLAGGFCCGKRTYNLQIRAIVADLPARTFILDSIGHTGYSSCTKCTIEGVRIRNTMCFPGFSFELRTDASVRNRDDKHHHHSMEPTILESLPINMVDDVIVENMHCTYLGVQKQLLTLWIVDRRERYSMPAVNIRKLSADLFNISHQLPNEFSRFPRPLQYLKRYKATEFRQLLLYTLPILLEGKLSEECYDHFLKLNSAMRILCDPVECINNNALAYNLLYAFVRDFEEVYGLEKVTLNVHSLLHIPADVKKMNAPVDDYGAFKFENYMQYIKKLPRTGYRVLEQMHNRIYEKNSIENYWGDFWGHKKKDRFVKKSSRFYERVYVFNIILSIHSPDNYVFVDENVHKIEEISKTESGNFKIKYRTVQNLKPLYSKPISSMDVRLSVSSEKEVLSEPCVRTVCEKMKKCAAVYLNDKHYYMALLH